MPHISLRDASLEFPVYQSTSLSLKRRVAGALVGGTLDTTKSHLTIVRALDHVNLELKAGDRVGLVGHNGAGKTSLLRLLGGIYEATSGIAVMSGRATPLLDIGHGVDPDATGFENIIIRGLYLGLSISQMRAASAEIGAFTGLGDFLNLPVRTYSAGMISRLLFATSTHFPSDILLIDEGIIAGDTDFQIKAKERLDELVGKSGILVLASHSEELRQRYCSRVLHMEAGRIVGTHSLK